MDFECIMLGEMHLRRIKYYRKVETFLEIHKNVSHGNRVYKIVIVMVSRRGHLREYWSKVSKFLIILITSGHLICGLMIIMNNVTLYSHSDHDCRSFIFIVLSGLVVQHKCLVPYTISPALGI